MQLERRRRGFFLSCAWACQHCGALDRNEKGCDWAFLSVRP